MPRAVTLVDETSAAPAPSLARLHRHAIIAGLGDDGVRDVVRAVLADPDAELLHWWSEPVDYDIGSPTTDALMRVRGVAATHGGNEPWSVFVKVIRSFRHWPLLDVLPADLRARALNGEWWRYEIDLYGSGVDSALPAGMRLPQVHTSVDLGDDRIALWLEDVATSERPWDLARFERAGLLLGRLAGRLTNEQGLPPSVWSSAGEMVRAHYTGRVLPAALPVLRERSMWRHPAIAECDDTTLGADLFELSRRLPAMLAALDCVAHVYAHGDASPQNLLVPAAEPSTFVVIDWSFGGLAPAGYDLGQLLIGLGHSGELDVEELASVRNAIVPAYTNGLADEGVDVDQRDVRFALDAGLVVRSAFTALPLDRLGEPMSDQLGELFAARLRLTRYLVDLGLALPLDSIAAA